MICVPASVTGAPFAAAPLGGETATAVPRHTCPRVSIRHVNCSVYWFTSPLCLHARLSHHRRPAGLTAINSIASSMIRARACCEFVAAHAGQPDVEYDCVRHTRRHQGKRFLPLARGAHLKTPEPQYGGKSFRGVLAVIHDDHLALFRASLNRYFFRQLSSFRLRKTGGPGNGHADRNHALRNRVDFANAMPASGRAKPISVQVMNNVPSSL